MGYGLYQGLNEAYDSFRGRERDIEASSDREADRISREETARRATEDYEYGLSRRPVREEAEDLALKAGRREDKRGVQDTAEHLSPEAIESRRIQMTQQNELLSQQLQSSGIKLDQTKLDQKAAVSRRKYQEWSERWNDGSMTVEDLVTAFNTDDLQGNNIAEGGVKEVGEGWEITMENGVVQQFADRRAVTQHLQESSSPEFLQTMLLNELKSKADLAQAMFDSDADASVELNKRGNAWIGNTDKEMKSAMGKVFPNGIASFGADGDGELAQSIRAMTNRIGRAFGYDVGRITPTEVATEIGIIAKQVMETDPAARDKRSAEIIENMGDQEFEDKPEMFPKGRPDPGDDEYKSLMKSLNLQQARGDMKTLEQEVYARFTILNGETGDIQGKDNRKTGEKESAIPVPDRVTTQTTSSEGGSTSSEPPPEPIVNVGSPEYYEGLEKQKAASEAGDAKITALEDKLGMDRTKGPEYSKKIATYIKGSEFSGLPIAEQKRIVDHYDDNGLNKVQVRKAKAAIKKREKRKGGRGGLAPR